MSNKKDRAIRISERTRDTLKAIRSVNETYDDTIKRLFYESAELIRDNRAQEARIRELEAITQS